jgi:hypothetical protein
MLRVETSETEGDTGIPFTLFAARSTFGAVRFCFVAFVTLASGTPDLLYIFEHFFLRRLQFKQPVLPRVRFGALISVWSSGVAALFKGGLVSNMENKSGSSNWSRLCMVDRRVWLDTQLYQPLCGRSFADENTRWPAAKLMRSQSSSSKRPPRTDGPGEASASEPFGGEAGEHCGELCRAQPVGAEAWEALIARSMGVTTRLSLRAYGGLFYVRYSVRDKTRALLQPAR